MAIDALGRVVVGGAKFAENGERIFSAAQMAARGADQLTPVVCRLMEAAGANPGHVMVGNSQLPPHLKELVREATVAMSNNEFHLEFSGPQRLQIDRVPHASTLVRRMSNPCLMEINHNEREREWRERSERDFEKLKDVGKSVGLMTGSAFAGDAQGALENGLDATKGLAEMFVDDCSRIADQVKSWFGIGD